MAGAHVSVGRGVDRDRAAEGKGAWMPSHLQLGRLSTSCNGDAKARKTADAQPGAEESQGLPLAPGPGERPSRHRAGGGQGAETQLQGFAARDPMGRGQ